METKFCKECDEFRPIGEFYKSQKVLLCKYHVKERGKVSKKKYRESPENKKKEFLKYQERKIRLWPNFLLQNSKSRNCENTLTIDDILNLYKNQNGLCYWFKIPLVPSLTNKHPQQPSLDRLDINKGYTKDNVVLCCYSANIGRNETELSVWSNFIKLLHGSLGVVHDDSVDDLYKKINEIDNRCEYVIYDENLNQEVTKNLNEYSKLKGISVNTIQSNRKKINRKTQKGLIILNRTNGESVNKRIYHLISPEKKEYRLYSLRKFCIENDLNDSALQRVAKGEIKSYKGWLCKYENITLK